MYHLFAGYNYYPSGFNDYVESYPTEKEAIEEGLRLIEENHCYADWFFVLTERDGRLVLVSD